MNTEGSATQTPEFETEFTNRNVAVFSDDVFFSDTANALFDVTHNVSKRSDLSEIGSHEIVIISESWIYSEDKQKVDKDIEAALKKEIPLIFVGKDLYLFEKSAIELGATTYTGNESAYCIYVQRGINYIYNINNDDESQTMRLALSWANEVLSKDPFEAIWNFSWLGIRGCSETDIRPESKIIDEVTRGDPYWSIVSLASITLDCAPHGGYASNVIISKLMNYDDGNGYYAFHYRQLGEPNLSGNYRLADIYLKDLYPETYLYDHGPNSTSGVTTVGVSMGFGINGVGPSGNAAVSWSYAIGDVVLLNTSQITTKKINFWHDVNEKKAVGQTYAAEPGIVYKVPNNATLRTVGLGHEVQFCKAIKLQPISGIPLPEIYDNFKIYGVHWWINVP